MMTASEARQVTIFVNSNSQWNSQPLYAAIVQSCMEHGIAGASVSRCVTGYGAGHKLHTTRLLELSENLPMRIEIVDVRERIDPWLTAVEPMLGDGLVTLHDIHILKPSPTA